jgi:CoA:oxalate CoA-transferase
MNDEAPGLLEGVLVVEVAEGVAGPFAARLLTDLGARCIKIEPPAGDVSRAWGATTDHGSGPSAEFLAFNFGKESVVADLGSAPGMDLLTSLLAKADVVIDDGRLDVEAIRREFPRLVVVCVTPFGRGEPFEGRPATELVAYAFGGAMSATGLPDRPPHYLGGSLVQTQAGNVASCAAMAALLSAESTGEGQLVDIAWVEAEAGGVDRAGPYLLAYSYCGENAKREAPSDYAVPAGSFVCADGYVAISTYGWTIPKMLDTLNDPELETLLREKPGHIFKPEVGEVLDRVLRQWLSERTKVEITKAAQANGWTVTPGNAVLEIKNDPFLRGANAIVDVEVGGVDGPLVIPGPAFTSVGGPRYRGPAPLLGADTSRILDEFVKARS